MKRALAATIVVIIIASIAATGCSSSQIPSCLEISPPDIHMTGEKTVIEKQIVGDYKELEKDAWIISSARTNVQRTKGAGPAVTGDEELFRAMKIREFHQSKLRTYKNEGAIGEANTGLVAYLNAAPYESDRDLKRLLMIFIEEENKARRAIFRRSLVKSGVATPDDAALAGFGRAFAEEQRALAKPNDWIQDARGAWTKKK
ncbi:MAG TPA: DUF1318 domain-containing protein [Spirochaetota bacterium]|nr:DUF1318 domain-containing protein [Spirochaetota bacterium]HNT09678.1 DUF1318 domain-containing protein [Spirochaetota bacterium]